MMTKPYLLLLMTILSVQALLAQPNLPPGYRKLSPLLQKNKTILLQSRVFWLVVSNTDSAKTFFKQHQLPVQITGEYNNGLLVVQANWRLIDSLLPVSPFIRFVDVPRQPHEELALSSYDIGLNAINLVHSQFPILNGSGLVVSVKENKFDSADIDFTGRYLSTPLGSSSYTSHATIMTTTIAGGGNSFFTSEGAAKAATVTSSDFASLLPDADNDYRQYGISVQNHSYGTGVENYYGADAAAYDASINNNPGLLHVFSAGNSGNATSSTGTYTGISSMANLTGSFKMAKNIITVGATDSFGNVAFLSSKGPAYDGRIKPELVAFGEDGSSGAAALTSGAVLLLQQQYKQQNSGVLPPSALIKAILLNSANDIGTPGPDFQSGYGILNAYQAMQTLVNNQFASGTASTGSQQTFSLTVPANTRQLKITLCWNDAAATANAPKALINDLDLELLNTTTSELWLPWVLSTAAVKDSLLLPAVRKKDSLNNAEQITISNPAAGVYTIRIKGYSVKSGPQPFYIAWQLDTANRFRWQYPAATDFVTGAENTLLRWSSTFDVTTGVMEYSLNKGVSWQTISNATPPGTRHMYWQAPDTFCTALLRMTINGQVFTSDTFIISHPLPLKVGFNCADSVMYFWKRIPEARAYIVYQLGSKYLQPLTSTTDTSIIIHQPGTLWYAVAPVTSANVQGMKSYAVNYTTQGVGCYLKTFLADLAQDSTALLTIEIATTYNIRRITVEKLTPQGYTTLQTFAPVTDLLYYTSDIHLANGPNTYRVKIELNNGAVIYSEPETVYYLVHTHYVVFPNPVKANGYLQVVSYNPTGAQLLMYNMLGQKVRQYTLSETTESIPLHGLRSGIYFVLILKNGKKDYTGRLMVY